MDIIIQHNMLKTSLLLKVREAVQHLPHKFVGLIPFSREITSDHPIEGLNHIPYGSTSFVETAIDLKWSGLLFDKEKFTYRCAVKNRGDMLNDEMIAPAKDVVSYLSGLDGKSDIFIRPSHDLKQFSGYVSMVSEALDFFKDAMNCTSSGSYRIEPDLDIVVSTPKNIISEWRWFIVGNSVIDGSLYRHRGELVKSHVEDNDIFNAAQISAMDWLLSACCVMDTCLLDDRQYKVVEFNCINGSGFYDYDIKKIMTALYEYSC